jgi:hypothetical protein
MKRLFLLLVSIIVVTSCDFSSGRRPNPAIPVADTLGPKKPPSPFHKKVVPVPKKDTVIVTKDDSLSKKYQILKEQNRLLEEEIKKLNDLARSKVDLKKSTYYPTRAQQVQEILNFIYNKKMKVLKNSGMKTLAGHRLRKICDIDYCDDAVLESLDRKCEWLNRVFADGIQMNFDEFYTDEKLYYKITYADERKRKKSK